MADVRKDRGQLILITALGLAILLVSLALIVNTAIYTENLATRSSKAAGGSEVIQYEASVQSTVAGLIEFGNFHHNETEADLQTNLTKGVATWSDHAGTLYATSGSAVNVSVTATENGSRIAQTDTTRNFSNASLSSDDWIVVTTVDRTRQFRINVTDGSTLEPDGSGNAFTLILRDGGGSTWRLNITSTDVYVKNGTGTEFTCSAPADPWVNLTAGTVGGTVCPGLSFADGVSSPYEIEFKNPGNITGTYTMIVDDGGTIANSPGPHLNTPAGGSPFATHAIYEAEVRFVYQTPRIYVERSTRIAPGDNDG